MKKLYVLHFFYKEYLTWASSYNTGYFSNPNLDNINKYIKLYKDQWIHYEVKEIEFKTPEENWIIKYRWKHDPNHLYHRGGFKSKKEAEDCWNREKNDYEVLIRIFKEPPPNESDT